MSTQTEIVAELKAVKVQNEKIYTEIAGLQVKIVDLEAALANQPNAIPELREAVDELKTSTQALDDLVPDAVVEPPVEPTP